MAQRATPIPTGNASNKISIDANGKVTGGATLNNGGVLKIDVDSYKAGYNQCQVTVTVTGWGNSASAASGAGAAILPGGTIKVGS
jgi:hypothetical protein